MRIAVNVMSIIKTVAVIQGSVLCIHYSLFVIGLGRIRNSFDHLPVDPGCEFFEGSYGYGIFGLVKPEGQNLNLQHHFSGPDVLCQQLISFT